MKVLKDVRLKHGKCVGLYFQNEDIVSGCNQWFLIINIYFQEIFQIQESLKKNKHK